MKEKLLLEQLQFFWVRNCFHALFRSDACHYRRGFKRSKIILYSLICLYFIVCIPIDPAFADDGITTFDQSIRFTSSPNPVGSGARALGMGGAFISVCDDATAASWNPAGLVQLEKPELSVVYDYNKNEMDSRYNAFPDALVSDGGDAYSFNYLSAVYPFRLFSRNMTASVNYQHLYDFNNDSSRLSTDRSSFSTTTNSSTYSLDGELWALSPAFSIQITPVLSVGMTLNFWEDALFDNQWTTNYTKSHEFFTNSAGEAIFTSSQYFEKYEFSGFNFHLGVLWNINSKLTVGAVFKSPFTADLKYRYHSFTESSKGFADNFDDPDAEKGSPEDFYEESGKETLDMPMSLGLGISFRTSDSLSFALDVYKTYWKNYILHPYSRDAVSPISGQLESLSGTGNTTQVRLGAEYLIIREKFIIPLRCGLFHDPEPSMDGTVDFWGGALGTGIAWKNIAFDAAFQYRTGDDFTTILGEDEVIQKKSSYTVYASLIYYF